jgi:hypothetical protein
MVAVFATSFLYVAIFLSNQIPFPLGLVAETETPSCYSEERLEKEGDL